MSWLQRHWLVVVLFTLYGGLLIRHAVEGWRRSQTLDDYYVGGRRMSGTAIGLSFFATYVSTNTFIGLAGQSYSYGVSWLLFGVFFVACSLIAWSVIAPRLSRCTRLLGSVTIADFIGLRF
ncbi:MAG: hypothetical protein NZM12_12610, partial [Steroidobacteraceae bacterium]|nr:hypothetical protein [Steroidobacteraceae bacterium]